MELIYNETIKTYDLKIVYLFVSDLNFDNSTRSYGQLSTIHRIIRWMK